MSGETGADEPSRPDWVVPAVRSGLEVTLVALIAAYLWVHLENPLVRGVVAVLGIAGAVAVLFWYVNEQALAWVRYASEQGRRARERQRHERRERRDSERPATGGADSHTEREGSRAERPGSRADRDGSRTERAGPRTDTGRGTDSE